MMVYLTNTLKNRKLKKILVKVRKTKIRSDLNRIPKVGLIHIFKVNKSSQNPDTSCKNSLNWVPLKYVFPLNCIVVLPAWYLFTVSKLSRIKSPRSKIVRVFLIRHVILTSTIVEVNSFCQAFSVVMVELYTANSD